MHSEHKAEKRQVYRKHKSIQMYMHDLAKVGEHLIKNWREIAKLFSLPDMNEWSNNFIWDFHIIHYFIEIWCITCVFYLQEFLNVSEPDSILKFLLTWLSKVSICEFEGWGWEPNVGISVHSSGLSNSFLLNFLNRQIWYLVVDWWRGLKTNGFYVLLDKKADRTL